MASTVAESVIPPSVICQSNNELPKQNISSREDGISSLVEERLEEIRRNPKEKESAFSRALNSISDSKLEVTSEMSRIPMTKTKSEGEIPGPSSFPFNLLCEKNNGRLTCSLDESDSRCSTGSDASVHDYENMAFLNVNRTDWGIRHWKSYSDIETNCHDYSVCKVTSIALLTISSDSLISFRFCLFHRIENS